MRSGRRNCMPEPTYGELGVKLRIMRALFLPLDKVARRGQPAPSGRLTPQSEALGVRELFRGPQLS